MRRILLSLVLTLAAAPSFAACQDVQDAVARAVQERSTRVSSSFDTLVPDPESQRNALAGCLNSVNSIGAGFSLGVHLPSMDQIVGGICNQVDSMIHQKVNEAHSQVLNTVRQGHDNPFTVYGTPGDYAVRLKNKLR